VIGIAAKETAIGDSIGLAIRTLEDARCPEGPAFLVLLTDGATRAGAVEPRKARDSSPRRAKS